VHSGSPVKSLVGKLAPCYYQCCYCGRRNNTAALMREHIMRIHLKYKPYSCLFCSFRAVKGFDVTQHIRHKHSDMSNKRLKYSCVRDEEMEHILKNGYDSFRLHEPENLAVKLQDHTYNAISSAADKIAATNVCQNNDNIQSDVRVPTDTDAQKTAVYAQKKLHTAFGSVDVYRCPQCTFEAVNKRSMNMHILRRHSKMLKCAYCKARGYRLSEMYIHWGYFHRDFPFTYHQVDGVGSAADVTTPTAGVQTTVNEDLHALPSIDDNQSNILMTYVPSSKADAGISTLTCENANPVPCQAVDDIIYCCPTCPGSFSTPEALSLHKCTSSM